MNRVLIAVVALLSPTLAFAQEWEYILQGKNVRSGALVLEQSGTESWVVFKFEPQQLNECVRGRLPATATRSAEHTTIEIAPTLAKCETVRFVVRNDGEGGRREVLRDGKWAWDGLERSLRSTAPVGRPTAKIRFLRGKGSFSLSSIDTRTCPRTSTLRELVAPQKVRTSDDTGASIPMLGTPPKDSSTWRQRSIRAGETFRFVASSVTYDTHHAGITYFSCHRAGQFVPAAGGEYELAVGYHGQACTLSLVRLSLAAEGSLVRTPESSLQDYGAPPAKRMGLVRWEPEEFCGKP